MFPWDAAACSGPSDFYGWYLRVALHITKCGQAATLYPLNYPHNRLPTSVMPDLRGTATLPPGGRGT